MSDSGPPTPTVEPCPEPGGEPVGDPVRALVGFTVVLRAAGLSPSADRVETFLRATDELGVTSRTAVYWAGRLTLCADPDDLPVYDRAFADWFDPTRRPARGPGAARRPRPTRLAAFGRDGHEARTGETTDAGPPLRAAASATELLRHRDLAELSPAQREHLRRLLELLAPDPPTRPARRRQPARRGPVDPRRTLRALLRAHGELRTPVRRARANRPRRVVLLLDVSGSMQPYADALLRFCHVVVRRIPAGIEVFTLGTRLTRVTRELRGRDPELALAAAGRAIPDWSGGTRLGEVLGAFVDRWGRRGAARGAVVVIFSDGWERGDPTLLGVQAARLARLARRMIWVNPHAGKTGYAPVQGGIAAALPHLDALLAGHSLATLEELLDIVRGDGAGRGSIRPQIGGRRA